jgi:hypothetical protein
MEKIKYIMLLYQKPGGKMKIKKLLWIPLLALFCANLANAAPTTVSIVPATNTITQPGITFSLNVTVTEVTDLWGWEFILYFNNSAIHALEATEGAFLSDVGSTLFTVQELTNNYNATHGRVWVYNSLKIPALPASGSGLLATITMNSTAVGQSDIALKPGVGMTYLLVKKNADEIPHDIVNGSVTVVPEFPSSLIVPLLLIATLATLMLSKKAFARKPSGSYIVTQNDRSH